MSEVFEDFVEPYRDMADDYASFQKLLTLGMLAWNMALFPHAKRQKMFDDASQSIGQLDQNDFNSLKTIVTSLVERKDRYFRDNRRLIISFDLVDNGGSYYMTVMSTLDVPK